jgi:hypothetical protein
MVVDDNIWLIARDPQGILYEQLRHYPILLLNVIIVLFNYVKNTLLNIYKKLMTTLQAREPNHSYLEINL